jgi:hypothetical protein
MTVAHSQLAALLSGQSARLVVSAEQVDLPLTSSTTERREGLTWW